MHSVTNAVIIANGLRESDYKVVREHQRKVTEGKTCFHRRQHDPGKALPSKSLHMFLIFFLHYGKRGFVHLLSCGARCEKVVLTV